MNANSYSQTIFSCLKGKDKNFKEKVMRELYDLGKEGDYSNTGNSKMDSILQKLAEDDSMPDIIGDVYSSVQRKLNKKNSNKTRKQKNKTAKTKRR